MKKYSIFILLFLIGAVFLFTACTDDKPEWDGKVSGKSYVYEGEGFGSDFVIRIDEDGAFSYYEGIFSSYFGVGTWTLDGDVLHLTDMGIQSKVRDFYFRVDEGELVFLAKRSDKFTYLSIEDGERFSIYVDPDGKTWLPN